MGSRLLSTDDETEANELAAKLEQYNEERKAIEFIVFEQALEQAKSYSEDEILITLS
jgi:single-stranded-DNA-specific exonuclease